MISKIKWCLKQKYGIELVEPNDNLSKEYFKEAEDTLKLIEGKENKWELIMAYYACYNAFYALLMKAGIKCEIHDCTIEIMGLIPEFTKEDYDFLSLLKDKRIQAQYYLKRIYLDEVNPIKHFVLKCEEVSQQFNINNLRKKLNVSTN